MASEATSKPVAVLATLKAVTPTATTIALTKVLDAADQQAVGTQFWHQAIRLQSREQVINVARTYLDLR